MTQRHAVAQLVDKALADFIPVKVLRGMDVPLRDTGDIDFIVPSGMAMLACLRVAERAIDAGWHIVSFKNRGYVCSVILFEHRLGADDFAIKLDFVSGLSWRGLSADYAPADVFSDMWCDIHKEWSDERSVGAISFIQKILSSGTLSDTEWCRISKAGVDVKYLAEVAHRLRLPISADEIRARRLGVLRKWRLRAASNGVGGPLSFIVWLARAGRAYADERLGSAGGKGMLIGLSGLDGAGKSTILERFVSAYRKADDGPLVVHLLPTWIPMPHQIFRRRKTDLNYARPYSEVPVSSKLNGAIRLTYYCGAFLLAKAYLTMQVRRGRLVLMDRSFFDFASDLARARIPHAQLPGWFIRTLLPEGMLVYVFADAEAVVARKGELTADRAKGLIMRYARTVELTHAICLDGNQGADGVFHDFLNAVSAHVLGRIRCVSR